MPRNKIPRSTPKAVAFPVLARISRTLMMMLLVAGIIFFLLADLSVERILMLTPENMLLAALSLVLAYCVVSVFFVFPLILFYLVAGLLFPPGVALLVNTVGIAGNITLPFLFARHAGKDQVLIFLHKYPRLAMIHAKFSHDQWFFAFILRAVNLLPVTGVSLFLGLTDIPYRKYLSATLCGMIPAMIPLTLMGDAVRNPASPQFWWSILLILVTTLLPVLVYRFVSKKSMDPDTTTASDPPPSLPQA